MKSLGFRFASAWALSVCIVAACGGRVDGVSGSSSSTSEDAGSANRGGGGSTSGSDSRDASSSDAALKGDANVCVDIEVAGYDTDCAGDDDCIDITAGTFCRADGNPEICLCGGTAVSASEQSRYEDQIAPLVKDTVACPCPYLGRARCVEKTCVFCPSASIGGSAPPGCPDAG